MFQQFKEYVDPAQKLVFHPQKQWLSSDLNAVHVYSTHTHIHTHKCKNKANIQQ